MNHPPPPNTDRYLLENAHPQQLLEKFDLCLKAGPRSPEYSLLPEAWGILFFNLYLSPFEVFEDLRTENPRLGKENEDLLRQFIKNDCSRGGKFVIQVIKNGGMTDLSALAMIADPHDLACLECDSRTAVHLLFSTCGTKMRPDLIRKFGTTLSSLCDRDGVPLLLSILGQSDLTSRDLNAITKVFSNDDLKKIIPKSGSGKNALDLLRDLSRPKKGGETVTRDPAAAPADPSRGGEDPLMSAGPHPAPAETAPAAPGGTVPATHAGSAENPGPGPQEKPRVATAGTPDNERAVPKIMIVDDDQLIRQLLQLRVKNLGYDPICMAENGEEAVKIAVEKKPDIVLLDISMPGAVDGIDAAKKIREHLPGVRIIFLTGHNNPEIVSRIKNIHPDGYHPDGYIHKPFTETDLRVAIELVK